MMRSDKDVRLFDCLPDEMLLLIFSFINVAEDYAPLAQVDKRFHRVVNTPSLWARSDLEVKKLEGLDITDSEDKGTVYSTLLKYPATIGLTIVSVPKLTAFIDSYVNGKFNTLSPANMSLEAITVLFNVQRSKTLTKRQRRDLLQTLSQIDNGVITGDPNITKNIHRDFFRKDNSVDKQYLHRHYVEHALFALHHPYLRPYLEMQDILLLANIDPKIAKSIVSDPFSSFANHFNEITCRVLVACLTYNDYYRVQKPNSNHIIFQYLKKIFPSHDAAEKLLSGEFSMQNLLDLAYADDRIALVLVLFPPFAMLFTAKELFNLTRYHTQHLEQAWPNLYLQRWHPSSPKAKASLALPQTKWRLESVMVVLLYQKSLVSVTMPYIQSISIVSYHEPPENHRKILALYKTKFSLKDGQTFTLHLGMKDLEYIHSSFESSKKRREVAQDTPEEADSSRNSSLSTQSVSSQAPGSNLFSRLQLFFIITAAVLIVGGIVSFGLTTVPGLASVKITLYLCGGLGAGVGVLFLIGLYCIIPSDDSTFILQPQASLPVIEHFNAEVMHELRPVALAASYKSITASSFTSTALPGDFTGNFFHAPPNFFQLEN